jgi:hypothetical protein
MGKAIAVTAQLDDAAMVRHVADERTGDRFGGEYLGPGSKSKIYGDDG